MRSPELLAEKVEEISRIADQTLTEVAPSRRDFTMFVATHKQGIALVPRLKRRDSATAGVWPDLDFGAFARLCDDTEAAALAVCTAAVYGSSIDDLRCVSDSVSAAVLRDDLCMHTNQLYQARLHGGDAVVIPAGGAPFDSLRELVAVSSSLHMTSVIEIECAAEIEIALRLAPAPIGLRFSGNDGFVALNETREAARAIPEQRTVILLSEVKDLHSLSPLNGLIDAAVVGDALLDAPDPAAAIEEFLAGA